MMITPNPSNKERPRLASRGLIFLGALAAIALLVFLFIRSRGKDAGSSATTAAPGERAAHAGRSAPRGSSAKRGGKEASGKPVISGNVYSMTTGEPLPGAAVAITAFEAAGNIMSPVQATKSDERGHFKVALPEGTYQLSASMDGYGPGTVTARSGDTVSIMLPESGVIEGHVRDENGAPVQRFAIDVLIAVPADAPAVPSVWSKRFESQDGSFRVPSLPIWPVVLRATAEGYAPAFTDQLMLEPKGHGEVDLTMMRGCALTGTVKDKSGTPLPKVFIDAESQLGAGEMSALSMETAAQAVSDDNGAFRLSSIPKGTVIVRGYDASDAVTTATIQVSDCDKLAPLDLVMSPGGSLTGIAREGDGSPLAGATLSLMNRSVGYVNVTSDKDGRFRFDDVPVGIARIELNYKGRSMLAFAKVEEGKETEQDISLSGAGKGEIRGRITAGGRPLAGARLMIASARQGKSEIGMYAPVTDEDGNYRVSDLAPGAYLITVVSVPRGRPAQIKADESVTVDLDVTPKPNKPAPERKAPPAPPAEQPAPQEQN